MIKFVSKDVVIEDATVVFSKTVVTVISTPRKTRVDNYTTNWRKTVELKLNSLGLNDSFIHNIVSGLYDHKPQLLKADCIKNNVDFYQVWKLIK